MCRSWEGAQPGSWPRLANGNIPYQRHHAQSVNGGWPRGTNPPFSMSSNCSGSSFFFHEFSEFCEICKPGKIFELRGNHRFHDCCSGTGYVIGHRVVRGKRNCIVCSLFCIFFIISIFFAVLWNCLFPNPRVLLFVHSPPHLAAGGRSE